jgi:hypothetical protein
LTSMASRSVQNGVVGEVVAAPAISTRNDIPLSLRTVRGAK